jgi:hypothetical protein
MGSVFNRGSKDRPLWYVQYRENGRWKMANCSRRDERKIKGLIPRSAYLGHFKKEKVILPDPRKYHAMLN